MTEKPKRKRTKRADVPLQERVSFTIKQGAAYLNLGESTVRRLIEQGRLACVKIDRSVRIRRCDLDAFLTPK